MKVNINRAKNLDLAGDDLENDENKEYYLLVRVEPTKQEVSPDGEVTQKVAVHNGLVYRIRPEDAQYCISRRNGTSQPNNESAS